MTFRRISGALQLGVCIASSAVLAQTAEQRPAEAQAQSSSSTAAVAQPTSPTSPIIVDENQVSLPASEIETDIDADIAAQQLSNAAQTRLARARDSVVQIRGFYGGAASSAFHGSGFAASEDGLMVTNYHVVSEAVLYPRQYRLEYVTTDGRTGPLQVYAIDIKNDLAVVKANDLRLPPLRIRSQIPSQGERAYAIGFPLNLGLTITEGVANGMLTNSFEQRIHYTGAINGGMSGGPALDANGAVYGVNVSVITARQLVGFVVPAKHIRPLLAGARVPLNDSHTPRQVRELVAAQASAHEAKIFSSLLDKPGTQRLFGYTLPTQISPATECNTVGGTGSNPKLYIETVRCTLRAQLLVQMGLWVGDITFQHRILRTENLHPLQFSQQVNLQANTYSRTGSDKFVASYACENALVSLDGFDARVTTCARQYRLFANLYDIAVTVVSINSAQQAVISQLDLRGVAFDPGMQFVRRYLGAMRWTR